MKNQASKHSLLNLNKKKPESLLDGFRVIPQFRLLEIRNLTSTAYILRFDKNNILFKAGQHLTLGLPGDNQLREYSIYSSENDPFLEVLIKEVDQGMVSKRLHLCRPGDFLDAEGPFGFFTLNGEMLHKKHLFIASGTGIAPFHSMAGSNPGLDYTMIHGIRFGNETYDSHFYPDSRYISCVSRENKGKFQGRVTDYIRKYPVSSETLVYLCGNCDMIYEVYDILTEQNFPADQIKTEVYF